MKARAEATRVAESPRGRAARLLGEAIFQAARPQQRVAQALRGDTTGEGLSDLIEPAIEYIMQAAADRMLRRVSAALRRTAEYDHVDAATREALVDVAEALEEQIDAS